MNNPNTARHNIVNRCVRHQGMRYIHRSGLMTHGNLKSTTCLVDSRWTIKVGFFGLHSLTGIATGDCAEDDRKYLQLLWTAPELLLMRDKAHPSGTVKGDVYSFGIMLQEILFRNSPFFDSDISAEGMYFLTERFAFSKKVCVTSDYTVRPVGLHPWIKQCFSL